MKSCQYILLIDNQWSRSQTKALEQQSVFSWLKGPPSLLPLPQSETTLSHRISDLSKLGEVFYGWSRVVMRERPQLLSHKVYNFSL